MATSSSLAEEWSPGTFENLHSLISDAISIPSVATAKRLKNEIDYYRPAFVNLLDSPQKNTEQRTKLEKGEMYINGVLYKLNADFIARAKAISDYLNVNEQLAATILQHGTLKQHEYNRDAVEVAVTMFHHERSWLIVCLELMVKHAEDENLSDVVRGVFNHVVTDLTESNVPKATGPGTTSFACKILETIELLRGQISNLIDADRKPPVANGSTSAASTSVATASSTYSPPHPALLGESVRLLRVQSLRDERESLSTLLFQISYQCQLSSSEIIALARQLQQADWSDSITVYLLTALLASIDASPERYDQNEAHLDGSNRRNALLHDRAFLTNFNAIICQSEWSAAPLQPVVLVQWTLFLKVLRNKNTILADSLQYTDDALEQMAEQAILRDAFDTITRYVLRYRLDSKDLPRSLAHQPTEVGLGTASVIEADAFRKPMEIEDEFQWFLEQQLQHMVTAVVYLIPGVLRKLKNSEEDIAIAHQNQQQQQQPHLQNLHYSMRRSQGIVSIAPLAPLRQDLAAFFKLVSVLYEDRPDAGILFWRTGSQLFAFLKWGTECRPTGMRTAYLNMLASLATGNESAQHAYNFLQSGGGRHPSQQAAAPSTQDYLSWQVLYQALEINYATLSRGGGTQMHPDEKRLLQSFLRLLRQVVKSSALARSTLYENQNSRLITLLFNLLSCHVPVDLKAAILDTIAAFAVGTGSVGAEIAKKIWFMLEDAQVLNTRVGKSSPVRGGGIGMGMGMSGMSSVGGMTGSLAGHRHYATGIEAELQIESTYETYVETLAFVNLINILIHSPSRKRVVRIGLGMASPSIPDNLGAGYREPGITPYVEFILNEIFLPALGRGYVDPGEKWKIVEACIRLIEKCLNTFDLHSFVAETMMGSMTSSGTLQFSGRYSTQSPLRQDGTRFSNASPGNTAALATGLLRHPGFFVIRQMLSQSQILDVLLNVVNNGVEAVNAHGSSSSYTRSVLQGLRVVHRMLQISPTFLEVLLPYLRKLNDTSSGVSLSQIMPMTPPPMDIVLSERNESVVQTAMYINCFTCEEIALLSVAILERLAETSYWGSGNLTMLLSHSSAYIEIIQGFAQKLEIDRREVHEDAFSLEQQKQTDDPHALAEGDAAAPLDNRAPYAQSVNLTILNLLLKNVGLEKSSPTIAHYLLGYAMRGNIAQQEVLDPRAMEYKTCLHVILDMLAQGNSDGRKLTADSEMQGEIQVEDDREVSRKALSSVTPLFTHHPIHAERCYQLIYRLSVHPLTSSPTMRYLRSRHYFERQIRVMPVRLDVHELPTILFAQLYQRAWILKSIAVELHLTMQNGMRSNASRLLELLYGSGTGAGFAEENQFDIEDDLEGGVDSRMTRFEQPLMKMLELFNSLDLVDVDLGSEELEPPRSVHFQNISFSRCEQPNERGCSVFNMRGVYALLLAAQRQLERNGALNSSHARNAVKEEMKAWVSFFIAENHRRELCHAKFECLSAWRQVVEVTLGECYELLEADGRESILYDLLGAILPKIAGDQSSVEEAESLSTIVISLMTKLRQDRQHQSIIQATAPVDKMPAWNSAGSRLPAERLHGILRLVLEGIQRTDGTTIMRGNLYAALLNYLQYTCSPDRERSNGRTDVEPFDETASLASSFVSTSSSRVSAHQHSLESGNLSVIHVAGERFLERVCRDASDGPDVWKTVAFSVLDALCVISGKDKANRVVKFMAARNFLRYFVDSLRQDDVELQEMMNNEDASPNPLFIYQAKMSLFLRIAQHADGANKLLDNGIVEGLIGCDVLRQRQEMELNVNGFEAFTPPVYQQYHEILQPVLQLFVCMLSTLGKENVGVVRKMVHFVDQSYDVISSILKDDTQFVTLSSLGEVRLATGLLYYLSGRKYNQADDSSVSALDAHVSSLLPKYLVTERWSSKLVPANEDDREMMRTERPQYPPLPTQISEWKDSADQLGKDICRNLLAICRQQTEAGNEEQFTPIFKISFAILKESGSMLAQGSTSTPTTGMLVLHLREATTRFMELRRQHHDIRYKWNNIGVLSVEEIGEIVTSVRGGDYVEELNIDQKSHLAYRILQKFMDEKRRELLSTLFVIETCLVLVQRHLEYWFVRYRPSGQGASEMFSGGGFGLSMMTSSTSAVNASECPSKAQVDCARNEARNGLGPVLTRLATVELTTEEVGIGHRTRTSFVQMLIRKIRDVVMQD